VALGSIVALGVVADERDLCEDLNGKFGNDFGENFLSDSSNLGSQGENVNIWSILVFEGEEFSFVITMRL
jgi:hypothetical protein